MDNFDDIIDLPHHVSAYHQQMPMHKRAAQFSPFDALPGYKEAIAEAIRDMEKQIELKNKVYNDIEDL